MAGWALSGLLLNRPTRAGGREGAGAAGFEPVWTGLRGQGPCLED